MHPSYCSGGHRATTLLQVDDGISSISGMVLTQLLTIDYIRENGRLTKPDINIHRETIATWRASGNISH
ncbi:unnamed protein product [Urochloa humidicola]